MSKQTAIRLDDATLDRLVFLQGKMNKDRTFLIKKAIGFYYMLYIFDEMRRTGKFDTLIQQNSEKTMEVGVFDEKKG